jgi:hypothetical protein
MVASSTAGSMVDLTVDTNDAEHGVCGAHDPRLAKRGSA